MKYQIATTLLTLLAVSGCGGDGLDHFPTAKTEGTIVCEGKPVPFAMVYFEPLQNPNSTTADVGKPGFDIADENGHFVLSTYGTEDGAVVGKHRVRVDPPNSSRVPPGWSCPCEMNSNVDVTQVDVTEGENSFEIALKKQTKRSKSTKPPADADDYNDD